MQHFLVKKDKYACIDPNSVVRNGEMELYLLL